MFGLTPYRRNQVATWNPFSEMEELDRRFFNSSFFNSPELAAFKTDITDEGDHFEMTADLPGFQKEDIHLDINGDVLTIHAERHSQHEEKDKKGKYLCCERSYGAYSRSFDVSNIDVEKIKASYKNGVLDLKLPKQTQEKKPNRSITLD